MSGKVDFNTFSKWLVSYKGAVLVIALITLIRLFYNSPFSYADPATLFYDEAQYWIWSKSFEFGYYSKPPVIAWLISLTTSVCGNDPFCVKLSSPLLHAATAYIVFLLANTLFKKENIAFFSAVSYLLLPAASVSSAFLSTDVPLLFFWALGLYSFAQALDSDFGNDRWWLILGVVFGFGLLSKYTMVAFGACCFLYLLFSSENRYQLKKPGFWIAMIIALICLTPNIYWNALNNFVSFTHTSDNVFSKSASIYPMDLLSFAGAQFGVFGPLMVIGLIWALVSKKGLFKNENTRLLICFTLPLLLAGLGVSLSAGAQAHWSAPAYISGTILVVYFAFEFSKRWLVKVSVALHLILLFALYHVGMASNALQIASPINRLYTWNAIAYPASIALNKFPGTILVTDERKAVAGLAYNLRLEDGSPYPVYKWNQDKAIHDHFDLTADVIHNIGSSVIFISRSADINYLKPYFIRIAEVDKQVLYGTTFRVFYGEGFRGY